MNAVAHITSAKPSRPALRWHGGKWLLAPWIISHFPPHRIYTEVFGGAASVLLRKPRAYSEVYNDLDAHAVNLFRVLRHPDQAGELVEALRLTPFARDEFNGAYEQTDDPVERARRLIILSFMGFGSNGAIANWRTGFRADSNKSGTTPAHDWANYPDALAVTIERLRGVVIENRPAVDVLAVHDRPDCLHYVDPPYVHDARHDPKKHGYRHEMSDDDHRDLVGVLKDLKGMVILSGYPSRLYDELFPPASGWRRIQRAALADGASARTEVLWLNPAARAQTPQLDLLEAAE